jgi:hypothetical protein
MLAIEKNDMSIILNKPQKDVIHFMLPKNTVMQVADQVNKNGQASTPLMTFTLQPGGAAKGASSSMTGNMTNPTNATKSPGAVGGDNMTNPSSAKAANETAGTQSGGNNSMAGGSSTAGSGNATQSGNQTTTAANQQSANQTGNNTGNPLAKIPIIGKIFGGK